MREQLFPFKRIVCLLWKFLFKTNGCSWRISSEGNVPKIAGRNKKMAGCNIEWHIQPALHYCICCNSAGKCGQRREIQAAHAFANKYDFYTQHCIANKCNCVFEYLGLEKVMWKQKFLCLKNI